MRKVTIDIVDLILRAARSAASRRMSGVKDE